MPKPAAADHVGAIIDAAFAASGLARCATRTSEANPGDYEAFAANTRIYRPAAEDY